VRVPISVLCHITSVFILSFLAARTHTAASSSSNHRSTKKQVNKFEIAGPVLTVTLREPFASTVTHPTQSFKPSEASEDLYDSIQDKDRYPSAFQRVTQRISSSSKKIKDWITENSDSEVSSSENWLSDSIRSSLSSLAPSLSWSIRSTSPPLPKILPSLRSIAWTLVYQQNPFTSSSDPLERSHCPVPSTLHTTSPLFLSTQIRFSKRLFQSDDFSFFSPFSSWRKQWDRRRNTVPRSILSGDHSNYSVLSTSNSPVASETRYHGGVPVSLELVPIHHLDSQETSLTVQLGLGESVPQDLEHDLTWTSLSPMYPLETHSRLNLVAYFSNAHSSKSIQKNPSSSSHSPLLRSIHGSYHTQNLPSFTSLQSLSIHPTYDFPTNTPTCMIKAQSSSGRTTALFDFNWEDPTFAIIHDLDEYNTISPEISLSTSSIVYNWRVRLENHGSICTRVDPMSCIDVTWTDPSGGGGGDRGGKWVTNVQLPLSMESRGDGNYDSSGKMGTASWKQAWKPNIRVRRTFAFGFLS